MHGFEAEFSGTVSAEAGRSGSFFAALLFLGEAQSARADERCGGDHPAALGKDFEMVQFQVEQGPAGGDEQPVGCNAYFHA